ncbi:hypothetical protein C8R45DRAFT_932273 [Mycena sanguinolenta]|nr:hypothetical protein C8R45DRAFT_932273 [Mycena sanguinolenta]
MMLRRYQSIELEQTLKFHGMELVANGLELLTADLQIKRRFQKESRFPANFMPAPNIKSWGARKSSITLASTIDGNCPRQESAIMPEVIPSFVSECGALAFHTSVLMSRTATTRRHHQNRKNLVDPGECRKAADGLQRDRNVGKAWAMAAQGFRTLGNWSPMLAN